LVRAVGGDDLIVDAGAQLVVGRGRTVAVGRALAGGFLVAVAAAIVFAAVLSGTAHSLQTYVVASQPLPPGALLQPADLTTYRMDLPPGSRSGAFTSPELLSGRTLAVAVSPGELVQSSMLVPVASSPVLRPVSVAVDPTSLTALLPGRPVDVLEASGTDTGSTVTVVMRGAVLMNESSTTSSVLAGPGTELVTLGVASLPEVEAIVQAAHAGTVSLVAAEPSDGVGPGAGP
jgi:Flp pilus assembly protein CpaB